jgi:hypothetical protein
VYYLHTPGADPELSADADAVAQALESVSTLHSLQAALEVGEIVFRRIFKGDERVLRARGKKNSSFRKLASHPRLGMSPSSLWRAVAIYELSRRFPELTQYVHTGVGHISVVLGLPEAEQFNLLRSTESERWTRRRLQKEAAMIRGTRREATPLPRSRFLDRLAGLELLAHDSCQAEVSRLAGHELHEAVSALSRVRARLAEVEGKLQQALVE